MRREVDLVRLIANINSSAETEVGKDTEAESHGYENPCFS